MSTKKSSEIWKSVPGFPGYEVSNLGRVRSFWTRRGRDPRQPRKQVHIGTRPRIIRPSHGKHGTHVQLRNCRYLILSRLVLTVFVRPPKRGEVALHTLDPDPTNNRLENLRWGTMKENLSVDLIRHHGKHTSSTLSPKDVHDIRQRLARGESGAAIGRDYNVGRDTISLIKRRKHHFYV